MSVSGVGGPGGADWGQIPGAHSAAYTRVMTALDTVIQGNQPAQEKYNALLAISTNQIQTMVGVTQDEFEAICNTYANAVNGLTTASHQAVLNYHAQDPGFWNQVMGGNMSRAEALSTLSSLIDQIRNDPALMAADRNSLLNSFNYSKGQVEQIRP